MGQDAVCADALSEDWPVRATIAAGERLTGKSGEGFGLGSPGGRILG